MDDVQNTLLADLFINEVIPAIKQYNTGTVAVTWTSVTGTMHDIRDAVGNGDHMVTLCLFADRVSIQEPRQVAERAVGLLGVSKESFWCMLLHYALWPGLRTYQKNHGGASPDDFGAYLYAMLTADDLAAETLKDF